MNTNSVISDINSPILKAGTAIAAAVGANTDAAESVAMVAANTLVTHNANPWWFWLVVSIPWSSIASLVAAVYTTVLFLEWMWKKPVRWALVKLKVVEPIRRMTSAEWAKLHEDGE